MAERNLLSLEERRDLLVGLILLGFGIAWTVTVYLTVPAGRFGVGPRAFPFYLGVALVMLSAIMVVTTLLRRRGGEEPTEETPASTGNMGIGVWPLARIIFSVAFVVMAYGYLMQNAGFVLATALVVAFTLWFVLGVRRPLLVLGMAAGITAGCWLAFGVVLGAYIPRGTWLALF